MQEFHRHPFPLVVMHCSNKYMTGMLCPEIFNLYRRLAEQNLCLYLQPFCSKLLCLLFEISITLTCTQFLFRCKRCHAQDYLGVKSGCKKPRKLKNLFAPC